MEASSKDRIIDYFPIIAYFGFWLQGAVFAAILTGDTKLMVLGVVTAPAIAAMVLAIFRIARGHARQEEPRPE